MGINVGKGKHNGGKCLDFFCRFVAEAWDRCGRAGSISSFSLFESEEFRVVYSENKWFVLVFKCFLDLLRWCAFVSCV